MASPERNHPENRSETSADDTRAHDDGTRPESDAERIPSAATREQTSDASAPEKEVGGRGGLDPVRYGDWEKNGRCIDF